MLEIKRNVEKMSNYSLKVHLNNYSGRNTRVALLYAKGNQIFILA